MTNWSSLPTTSTIPSVLDELVSRLKAGLDDVQICDGMPVPPEDAKEDLICIGFTGVPGEPAIESNNSRAQMTTSPDRESYGITCIASSWKGHQKNAQLTRNKCFELINACAFELAKDMTLGGKCAKSNLSTNSVAQEQTSLGVVTTVRFVIHIEAFTRRG